MDLKTLSANLSCAQMTEKAKNELNYYKNKFNNIMKPSKCTDNYIHDDEDNNNHQIYKIPKVNNTNTNTNIGYLPFLTINKKTCITKKDFYNNGTWTNQFNDNLNINNIFFDKQTKNKFPNIKNNNL